MIDPLLTANDVAAILGLSPKTVLKLAREKKLGSVRVAFRGCRFRIDHVQEYIERQSTQMIDNRFSPRLCSRSKGGLKSSGVERQDLLAKEIKELCR